MAYFKVSFVGYDIDTIPYNKVTFMTNTESVMQGYINSEPLIMSQKAFL